jgi:hypothetical protein
LAGEWRIAPQCDVRWDPEQQAVIEAPASERLLVEAGPGTGKTAVACARVAELIDAGIDAANIWLVSFTRTAVKELRDRIAMLVTRKSQVAAVRICTLDSHAWCLRQGFDRLEARELFGSYETNITGVAAMLDSGNEDLLEYLGNVQHLIVDEAQDLVGNRSQLVLGLVRRLDPGCGVTVFYDSAQAIYGFTEGDCRDAGPLPEQLAADPGLRFRKVCLRTVYRTDSESLRRIFTDTRELVTADAPCDPEHYSRVCTSISDSADDTLVWTLHRMEYPVSSSNKKVDPCPDSAG